MTDSQHDLEQCISPHPRKRYRRVAFPVFVAAPVCGAILLALLGLYAVDRQVRSRLNARPVSLAPLVGTWAGDHGSVMNLRSDGTGRGRSVNYPTRGITRFRWNARNGRFSAEVDRSTDDFSRRLRRLFVSNVATEYHIVVMSAAELHLRDVPTGKIYVFRKSLDPVLETSP